MSSTTPAKITNEIISFCKKIDPTYNPVFIPVVQTKGVRFNYCMTDVPKFVEDNGGSVQYGWTLWEDPSISLEAEFHATWITPQGKLIDITPKPDGESKILYLKDSRRVYENKLVDNIRKPLLDHWFMKIWVMQGKLTFQIKKIIFRIKGT
jgi:hypothetical protein